MCSISVNRVSLGANNGVGLWLSSVRALGRRIDPGIGQDLIVIIKGKEMKIILMRKLRAYKWLPSDGPTG